MSASQRLSVDDLAGGCAHERRTTEKDRPLIPYNDRLVTHRRDIGAPRGAGTEHGGDLRNASAGHIRLVVEDTTEMVTIGKDLVLSRQKRASRIDQVNARQVVLGGDFLGAQVFLDRQRIVGSAFDRRIVRDDHALPAVYVTDARDDSSRRNVVGVDAVSGKSADFEKRRVVVEQILDAIPRQQLSASDMPLPSTFRATFEYAFFYGLEFDGQRHVGRLVLPEVRGPAVDFRLDLGHRSVMFGTANG